MDICKLRHLRYYSLAQCVSFYYIKKFSVKNWSRWNGTDYPLIQRTKLLKNVTQIIPMLPWVKLDKNDCINCVLSLINWDDTSGFMVSLFENWIDLYVGTSHFYIEATVIAILTNIEWDTSNTISCIHLYPERLMNETFHLLTSKTKSPNFIEISLHTQGQEEKFDNPPLRFHHWNINKSYIIRNLIFSQ